MRHRSTITLAIWLCTFALLFQTAFGAGQDDRSLSARRVALAEQLALAFFAQQPLETTTSQALAALLPAFLEQAPELPGRISATPLQDDALQEAVEKELNRLAEKHQPTPSRDQLYAQAAAKYPIYRPGDRVVVIYRANPLYTTAYEGIYQGRNGGYLKVGARMIRIADMAGLENSEVELRKFDQQESERLRQEDVAAEMEKHQLALMDFKRARRPEVASRLRDQTRVANEKAGYTLVNQAWLLPEQVMTAAIDGARRMTRNHRLERENQKRLAKIDTIEAQAQSLVSKVAMAPALERLSPEEIIRSREEEARRAADAEAQRTADAEARRLAAEREAERIRQEAELRQLAAAEQARQQTEEKTTAATPATTATAHRPMHRIILVAMLGLVTLGVIGIAVAIVVQRQRSKNTFKKFFEGKGKLQKDFWAMAEADPEHFKYVAYKFPDLKEANGALQRLSYIRPAPNGELRCTRDILFGAYPHQEGAVCFVGGVNLHYALWREASAILPELPNAVYFKVSTEPDVLLEIPDVDQLAADKDIHIENLGVQELAGENGEFTRCYRYRTDTKQAALDFLESFVVNEEGIVIHVETGEGTWGKDENGIFEV
jgi:hypothetical protein